MILGELKAVAYRFDPASPTRILAVDLIFDEGRWRCTPVEDGTLAFEPTAAGDAASDIDVSDSFPWVRPIGAPARMSSELCDERGRRIGVQLEFGDPDPGVAAEVTVQLRGRSSHIEVNAVYALQTPLRAAAYGEYAAHGTRAEARFRLDVDPGHEGPLELTLEPWGEVVQIQPGTWVDVEVFMGDGDQPEIDVAPDGSLTIYCGQSISIMGPDGTALF